MNATPVPPLPLCELRSSISPMAKRLGRKTSYVPVSFERRVYIRLDGDISIWVQRARRWTRQYFRATRRAAKHHIAAGFAGCGMHLDLHPAAAGPDGASFFLIRRYFSAARKYCHAPWYRKLCTGSLAPEVCTAGRFEVTSILCGDRPWPPEITGRVGARSAAHRRIRGTYAA